MSLIEELQQENPVSNENIEPSTEDNSGNSAEFTANHGEAEPQVTTEVENQPTVKEETAVSENDNAPENQSSAENQTPINTSFASEEVAKYNEFVKVTGREDYQDFKFWDTPTDKVDENDLLKKYLSEKEGMTEKEVNYELKRMELDEEYGDFGDNEPSEQEILRERTLRKAKEWHSSEFEKISKAKEEAVSRLPEKLTAEEFTKRAMEQQYNVYQENVKKVYETLPNITAIPLKVSGDESKGIPSVEVSFSPDEQFANNMKAVSEDIGIVVNQFYDEGAKLKDPKGWIENAVWAYAPTRERMIQFMIEQAVLQDRTQRDLKRRNVTADNYQSVSVSHDGTDAFEEWRKNRE